MNIKTKFEQYCRSKNIIFQDDNSVKSYDDTTLFCPAGMQQFKNEFKNKSFSKTIANVQACIRLNDFDELGDGIHFAYFNMLGLFSFREMSVKQAIDFWMDFIKEINIKLTHVTIHPDKKEWVKYYNEYNIVVKKNDECKWSDGDIGGYCTEFFNGKLELGNIVNPLGTCIDCGFGLERLELMKNPIKKTRIETLRECALQIIKAGFKPSNTKQGYVLRKILREIFKSGESINHIYFKEEVERQEEILNRYERLRKQFPNESKQWWYETHGIKL